MSDPTLKVKLDGSEFVSGGRRVGRTLEDIRRDAKQTGGALDALGRSVFDLKNQILAFASAAAITAVLREATQASLEFGRKMAEVSTLLSDTSQMRAITESAKALAVQYGSMPLGQAEAFYEALSAGASNATEATTLLHAANKLAVGGVTDVKTAVGGLTNVMNAYGPAVESAAAVSDAMFIAMVDGKTTIGEFAASVGTVAPLAAQAGVSFDQLAAAVAALTKGGVTTNVAMTGLRAILAAVSKPSQEAIELSRQLGIQFDTAAIKAHGFAGFMEEVIAKTGGSDRALATLFGGVEALVPVLALAGQAGEDFGVILEKMESKAGATERAFEKMANSPAFKLDQLKGLRDSLLIELGDSFIHAVLPSVSGIQEAFSDPQLLEGIRSLGNTAGTLLRPAGEAAAYLAKNLDLVAIAAGSLVVINIAGWLNGLAATSRIAAIAQIDLATAIWAVQSGYAKLIALDMASKIAAWAAAAATTITVLSGLAAVVGVLVLEARSFIKETDAAHGALLRQVSILQQNREAVDLLTSATHRLSDAQRSLVAQSISSASVERDNARQALRDIDARKRAYDDYQKALFKSGPLSPTEQSILQRREPPRVDEQELVDARGRYQAAEQSVTRLWEAVNRYAVATRDAGDATGALGNGVGNLGDLADKTTDQLRQQLALVEENIRHQRELQALYSNGGPANEPARVIAEQKISEEHAFRLDAIRLETSLGKQLIADAGARLRTESQLREEIGARGKEERALTAEAERQLAIWKAFEANRRELAAGIAKTAGASDERALQAFLDAAVTGAREALRIGKENAEEQQRRFEADDQWWAQFNESIRDGLLSINERARLDMGAVEESFRRGGEGALTAAEAERALAQIRVRLLEEHLSAWQTFFGFLSDQFGGVFQEILYWIQTIQNAIKAGQALNSLGGGGGGGWLGALKGLFGGKGAEVASARLTAEASYGQFFQGGAAAGQQSAQLANSASAGYLSAAYALYVVYLGFFQKSAEWAEVSTRGVSRGKSKIRGQVEARMDAILKDLREFSEALDIKYQEIGDVTLGKRNGRYYVKDHEVTGPGITQTLAKPFDSAEAAMEYLKVRALQLAKYGDDVSAFIQAAIRGSSAENLRDFESDVARARRLESAGKPQAQLDFEGVARQFRDDMDWVAEIFKRDIPQMAVGFRQAATIMLESFQSASASLWSEYNSLRGIKEDPAAEDERRRVAFNAQRAIISAQITLMIAEIDARIAAYNAHRAVVRGTGTLAGSMLDTGFALLKGGGVFQAAGDAALAQLQQTRADLERLQRELPPALEPGDINPRRGGGGGRGDSGGSDLSQMLRDHERERSLRGASDFERGRREIQDRWNAAVRDLGNMGEAERRAARRREEAIQAAKGNEEAIRRANQEYERATRRIGATREEIEAANKARDEEIRWLREEQRARHDADLKPYLQDWGKSQWEIQFSDLQTFFEEKRKEAREIGRPVWKVDIASQRANQRLGQDAVASLNLAGSDFAQSLRTISDTLAFIRGHADALGISGEQLAEITRQTQQQVYVGLFGQMSKYITDEQTLHELKQLQYQAERAGILANITLAESLGAITAEQARRLRDLADRFLPENLPGAGGGGPTPQFQGYNDQAPTINYTQILSQARTTFTDMVRALRDSNRSLVVGENSPYNRRTQRDLALQDYEATLARARGGDSTAWGELDQVRQSAIDALRAYHAGGAAVEQFIARSLAEFTALGTDPLAEQRTVEDLMRRQIAESSNQAQAQLSELQAIRGSMLDFLITYQGGPGNSNLYNGSAAFAASYQASPVLASSPAAVLAFPAPALPSGGLAADQETKELLRDILKRLGGPLEVKEGGQVKEDVHQVRRASQRSSELLEDLAGRDRSARMTALRHGARRR